MEKELFGEGIGLEEENLVYGCFRMMELELFDIYVNLNYRIKFL